MAARKTMEEVQIALNELADQAKNLDTLEKSLSKDMNTALENLGIEEVLANLMTLRVIEIMADYFGVNPNNLHLLKK